MPELPEVETICRGICRPILNQKISAVIVKNYSLRNPIPKNLARILIGQIIKKITRRGKYILLEAQEGTLIIHLGMSGGLQIKPQGHTHLKHEHVNIVFTNKCALCYHDPRRFGLILWTKEDPAQHPLLKNLGVEPLAPQFTAKYLFVQSQRRSCSIKQFIMDNKVVVGIGNIYACEALFAAKINPLSKAKNISFDKYKLLVAKIKKILKSAIEHQGTTFRDYSDSRGRKGDFQNKLKVYGRTGQCCVECNTRLEKNRIGQRSTVFCPNCQCK